MNEDMKYDNFIRKLQFIAAYLFAFVLGVIAGKLV